MKVFYRYRFVVWLVVVVCGSILLAWSTRDFVEPRWIGINAFYYLSIPLAMKNFQVAKKVMLRQQWQKAVFVTCMSLFLLLYPAFELLFFYSEYQLWRYFMLNTILFYCFIVIYLLNLVLTVVFNDFYSTQTN